ncbi:hemagglutinin repeat-containing protein [Oxalobacteraceae bacterium OTU3CAMAD1]|nr:hemagglutinin repeat-containing protein [Oxalobacteraceae bacterium OTU3CAMAD1]
MNKLCYRIVFNKRRGLLMAVQENASSQGKGRGQSGAASSGGARPGPMTTRVRGMTLALLGVMGGSAAMMQMAAAQIVADPNAPGRQQATVLNTANGVLQVNVQTPSAAGVSRNVYNRFDVPKSGAVLNNSRAAVQSQLGGWIDGNPWLAQGTARVILNEVNSNNPSQLRGYMEVAGNRAELVIANPAGIVVDGAGFINVSRATLTTGTPLMNAADGGLNGYSVQRGLISLEGSGLDARLTDYTALIARSVQLNAGVWAQQLEVTTGVNEVALSTDATGAVTTTLAPGAGGGEAPRYGVDTALLGGMYANKITLIGTEAGVGVRNAGSIGAAAGELVVTSAGRLENAGSLSASKALQLSARGGVVNSGKVYGEADVTLAGADAIDNSGTVFAAGALALDTPAAVSNSGTLSGQTGVRLAANTLTNRGTLSSDARAALSLQGDIDNSSGLVQAQSVALSSAAGGLVNQSGKIVQSGAARLDIAAALLDNSGGGQVGAAPAAADGSSGPVPGNGGVDSGAGGGNTGNPANGAGAGGDAGTATPAPTPTTNTPVTPVAPAPVPDGYLRIAGAIANRAGQIMSGGDIGVAVTALNNAGGRLNLSSLDVDGGAFSNNAGQLSVLNDFRLRTGAFDNHGGKIVVGGNFTGRSLGFDNDGGLLSAGANLALNSGAISNVGGKIVAAGRVALNADGAVANQNGYIQASTGLALTASGKLDNRAGVLETIAGTATMAVAASDIDNSKGRIANAGAGATSVTSSTNVLNSGVIGANGALLLAAQTVRNDGTVQSATSMELAIQRQLDNSGDISSGGKLDFTEDAATLNNSGRIAAGDDLTVAVAHANNAAGQIGTAAGSGADVSLSAQDIGNRGGKVIADRHLDVTAGKGGLDNSSGLMLAERDAAITVAGTLLNQSGAIEAAGMFSKLSVQAGAIRNTAGRIVNVGLGDTDINASSSIVSSGLIAGNGQVEMSAPVIENSGTMTSGSDLRVAVTRELTNYGLINGGAKLALQGGTAQVINYGQVSAADGMVVVADGLVNRGLITTTGTLVPQMSLLGGTLDNGGGKIIASGSASLNFTGTINNNLGTMQAGWEMQIGAGGALDNTGGVIEVLGALGKLDVSALSIDNTVGRIVNVGGGDTNVAAATSVFNSGLIAGNGALTLNAQTLDNTTTGAVTSGLDMTLGVSDRLQNDGAIQSNGTLAFSRVTAELVNTGLVSANGDLLIKAGRLNNDDGDIATAAKSDANLTIESDSLSNQRGRILSDGAGDIAVSGAADNQHGVVQTRRDLALGAGALLDNRNGIIETLAATSAMHIGGGAIDNTDGRIVSAGNGDSSVTSASYIQNNNLIAANGSLSVSSLTLANNAGGAVSSGAALQLAVRDKLDNNGIISSVGAMTSTLATATLTNAARIVAGGEMQLAAGVLNNDGGQIATLKQSQADVGITAAAVSNRGGLIQADRNAIFTLTGALNNAQGVIQAVQDLRVSAGGAINNTAGVLEAISAGSVMQVQAGAIDNTGGRIVNVGTGDTHVGADALLLNGGLVAGSGKLDVTADTLRNTAGATVFSGGDMTLGVTRELQNLGAINSTGTLDSTEVTAAVQNSGTIISGGKATLSAGAFDNNGGQLATVKGSGSDIALTSGSLSNRDGAILADHSAQLAVAGTADNTRGTIQARQDMGLDVGGVLNNTSGVIEAIGSDSTFSLGAGAIDNTGGRIVNVGTNDTSVSAQNGIVNSGLIAGNGDVNLVANTLQNQAGGNIVSGVNLDMAVAQQLDNRGTISSGGTLDFSRATAVVNNRGQIVSAGQAHIAAGVLNNDGGQIATLNNSGADILIDSQSMSNQGGSVLANGSALLDVTGTVNNTGGTIQALRTLDLSAGGLLSNSGGVIETASAASVFTISAGAINNGSGRLVNVGGGLTSISAVGAITSNGMIAGNGDLILSARTAQNGAGGTVAAGGDLTLAVTQQMQNMGTVSSAGTLEFMQWGASFSNSGQMISGGRATFNAASFSNDGGQIATAGASGADIEVDADAISNRGGKILASGDADLTSGGRFDNSAGKVQAGGDVDIGATGTLDNTGGAIEAGGAASKLEIKAGAIDSTAGRIVNVGTGDTNLVSDSSIVNSGVLAGNGDLNLSAKTLTNNTGGAIGAGNNLLLKVTEQLDNHADITSTGTLVFDQSAANLNNNGKIVAGDKATFVANAIVNDGGQIATAKDSGAELTVTGKSLSNVGGQILSDGKAVLAIDGALTNTQGTLHAGGDLEIKATGALGNDAGVIEAIGAASVLTLSAQSIDNGSGKIINIGSGDATITSLGVIGNNGTIAGNGNLVIKSTTLTSGINGNIATSKNLDLQVTQQLDNQGKINSAGTLTFNQAAATLNNSGSIVSAGNALIVANVVKNDGGNLGTATGSQGDLNLTTNQLSNEGGHITTGRDLIVVTHTMTGNGELQGGRDLALTMDGDYTQGNGTQQFHSNRDLSLTVTGNITNNATFEAVRNLTLSGNAVTNNAGAVIQAQGVAIKAAGDLNNDGEINGETALDIVSGGTVTNNNAIVGGDLTMTAQNLNNTTATSLVGATNSMILGVSGTVNNTGGATIYSSGSLAIVGALTGGQTAVVNNISSTIEAAGDLVLNAGTLNNIRENVSLVKVQTVDETKQMQLPEWYHNGDNHKNFDPNSANYFPHEVYFVNPDDIIENATFVAPDGNTYGRAVIRTHANDSAFVAGGSGLYSAYGAKARISMSDGTRELFYLYSSDNQANPDQGGPQSNAYQYVDHVTSWTDSGPTFSNQYGSCAANCVRFVTQPNYYDPTTIINREKIRSLKSEAGKLEQSRVAHHVAIEDQISPTSGALAQILSGGNMHMTVGQSLMNQYGNIIANGGLVIDGGAAIVNEGATLYRAHTFDGTWRTYDGDVTAYTMPTLNEVIGTAAGTISGGKGVSITGRSFTNVDVTAGTAGNILDSVNVVATGNNIATAASHASGSGGSGGNAYGQVGGSGVGNHASVGGLNGASGLVNNALANGQAGASGTGNNAQTMLDTNGSGLVNNAGDASSANGSGVTGGARGADRVNGSGANGGALGDLTTGRGAGQTQGASQVGGNANAVKVSPNGLSTINPDANGSYVFETRSQFANHGNWVSSDYLLNQLAMDPSTTQKRLGDGFYEQKMVRDQLIELTGRAPATGESDDSRYKALLTSGVSFAQQFNLRPGIALTADQISHLTSDIVWMETETVMLPDGTVEKVLVPKVYLAHAGNDAVKPSGALVTGAGVKIDTTDSIVNRGGLIDGGNGRTVLIAGQDIVNQGGSIKGGDVGLKAERDVINQSLSVKQEYASVNTSGSYTSLSNQTSITATGALGISAGRDVTDTGGTIVAASAVIQAGRDIAFNAIQTGSAYVADVNGNRQNDSSITNKVGQISTTGDLSLKAGQDIKLSGTQVNLGATGNGTMVAGRDISIAAVVDEVKTHQENDPKSKSYDKIIHEDQTVVGATVAAGGNLTIKAGDAGAGGLAIAGSNIAGGGDVSLAASGDVSITQVQENHLSDVAFHRESKSTFKKSSDTTADYSSVSNVIGGNVSGGSVSVKSGNDIVIGGSQLTAENALTLNAGRDLLVSSAAQTGSENHSAEHKKSGFSLDITEGVGYTKSQDNKTGSSNTVTQVGSVLSGGSVSATSGRDTIITGSTVVADKDIVIDAKRDLSIVSAENSVDSESASSSKKSGSIGTRFQAAVGTVKTTNDGTAESVTQVGSQIASLSGNVTLKAGGQYTQTSSNVASPTGDISIVAKDVLISGATNINDSTDHSTYSKTAIGGTVTVPIVEAAKGVSGMVKAAQGVGDSRMQALAALTAAGAVSGMSSSLAAIKDGGLRVSISLGNSKSENNVVRTSETAVGSTIIAGGNVSIKATGGGTDSNLTAIGSDIKAGGDVSLSADNDVNLLAAENTVSQHSTNKSSGASIGIGFGIGGASNGFTIDLAVSQARGKADGDDIGYTNSHVNAGKKVTVTSGGDTTLKGGVISGDSVVAQIGGDLNIESLQDSSKFDSKQSSSGLNASLCIPPFCYGVSTVGGNIGKSKVNGDFLSVLEQSGIKSGAGGFQVTVAGNTDLKGGVLSSSQVAVDLDKNTLTTGSLTASDLQNKDTYSASGYSFSGSYSTKLGDQSSLPDNLTEAQKKAASADGKAGVSSGVGSASGSQGSTTFSGISAGAITITNGAQQFALTGQDAVGVVAGIARGVTAENSVGNTGALTQAWDGQKLMEEMKSQVAITQAASSLATSVVSSYVDGKRTALQEQVKNATGADKVQLQEQLNDLFTQEKVMNVLIGAVTGNAGSALTKEGLSAAANTMRQLMVEDSGKFAGITDGKTEFDNLTGPSDGVRGDGQKVGGTRVDLDLICGASNERCMTLQGPDGKAVLDAAGRTQLLLNAQGQVQFDEKTVGMSLSAFMNTEEGKKAAGPTGGVQGMVGTLFGKAYAPGSWQDQLIETFSGSHDYIGGKASGLYDEEGNISRGMSPTVRTTYDTWAAVAIPVASPFAAAELLPPEVWRAISVFIGALK